MESTFTISRFCFDAFSVEQIEMVEMVIQMFKELFSLKMYVLFNSLRSGNEIARS